MSNSITVWLQVLRDGDCPDDDVAMDHIVRAYFSDVVRMAKRHLKTPLAVADEEDVAQSVFRSLGRAASLGRLDQLQDRFELWSLLLRITHQKSIDYMRRFTCEKRGHGKVQQLSVTGEDGVREMLGIDDTEVNPVLLAIVQDELQSLLASLEEDEEDGGETLKRIAILRMQNYSVLEISEKLSITKRSVERKLERIRSIWRSQLQQEDD